MGSVNEDDAEKDSTSRSFVTHWSRHSASFFFLQLANQMVNLLSGLFAVWYLSKADYALVTVAITLLGTIGILSNVGITIGLTSIGGRVFADPTRFGSLVSTALRLRHVLAIFIFPLMAVALMGMLWRAEADWWQITSIAVVTIGIATFELAGTLFASALLLRDRAIDIQRIDLLSAVLRLGIIATLIIPGWLGATTAILATLISTWLRNLILQRMTRKELDLQAPEVVADRVEILRLTRLEAPNAIFYCIQGQITIGIMTYFGSVSQIAEFGALGRLAIITNFLGAFIHSLLIPRFNRLQLRAQLVRHYLFMIAAVLSITIFVLSASLLFPELLLWFLGPKYSHLHQELPLMVGNFMLAFVVGISWSMNASKAWIAVISRANIPLTLATQFAIAPFMHLESLSGVVLFSLISQVPVLMLIAIDAWRGLRSAPSALP